jgi:hypothetical protein
VKQVPWKGTEPIIRSITAFVCVAQRASPAKTIERRRTAMFSRANVVGLMRPVWSYREWTQLLEGTLRFNPDHATVIQDQLLKVGTAAKTQLQSADSEPEPAHESRSVAFSRKDL